jgi:drug/metabolite transporter (DMT)-like permease
MDNPLRGVALLVAATFLFSTSDALAKILGTRLPVIEVGWFRYIAFVLMMVAVNPGSLRAAARVRSVKLQVLRGVTLVSSAILFILALKFMALADAASVGFVSPLMITALSVPLLGEVVGLRRWIAILVGFLGVLVVIRPGTGAFHPAALLVMGSSLTWAFASILTRRMAATEDSRATLLWSASVGLVLLTCAVPFGWQTPSLDTLVLNLVMGVVASAGQYLMVLAYRHAGASLLAPFSYAQLIWATGFGFLFFGTLPDRMTLLGAAIIVGSGMYTIHRERVRARERRMQPA